MIKEKVPASGKTPTEPIESSVPNAEKRSDGQHVDHWVLPESERAKGFIRPVRQVYVHEKCGTETRMGLSIAETYARDPFYYGSTFCCGCGTYHPVGVNGEFIWKDSNEKVGT